MLNVNQKTIFMAYSQSKEEGNNRYIVKYEAILACDDINKIPISEYIIDKELYEKHKEECLKDKKDFQKMVELWAETLPTEEENRIATKDQIENKVIL